MLIGTITDTRCLVRLLFSQAQKQTQRSARIDAVHRIAVKLSNGFHLQGRRF